MLMHLVSKKTRIEYIIYKICFVCTRFKAYELISTVRDTLSTPNYGSLDSEYIFMNFAQ